jgi:hypothetical protein
MSIKRGSGTVWALALSGALLTSLGIFLTTTSRGILDSDTFAERASASLQDPGVAAFVADRVTTAVVSEVRELTPVRPVIAGMAQALVSSVPFQVVVRTTAKTAHKALLSKGAETVFLSLPDVGALVRSVLSTLNPEAAAKIPSDLSPRLAHIGDSKAYHMVQRAAAVLRALVRIEEIALVLGPLLLMGAIVVARDRRRGVIDAGVALLVAAFLLFAILPLGRLVALVTIPGPLERHAATGLFIAFFSGLRPWSVTLAGIGLVLLSAGMSLLEAFDIRTAGRAAWARLTTLPASRGGQLASAMGFMVAGGLVVTWPAGALQAVAVMIGLVLCYVGLRELFAIILASVPEEAEVAAARGGRISVRLAVVGGVAVALIGAVVFALRPTHKVVPASAVTECNGAAELCDRRVDQVVFAGAHNAMSNADAPRWMFPHHERGIPRMLRDGVRAIAFDMHYGRPMGGGEVVKTAMDLETVSAEKIASAIGAEAVTVALRIRDRFVGGDSGSAAPYFCHGYCELGAYPVVPTLREMRDFLVEHPGEVLVLVIEDYISPEDVVKVFEESGLADFVYQGPLGPPWPTLRELINGGRRVMVFVETGKTAAPWVHPAFETIQETPYTFHKPEDFTCVANRGGTGGTLFQINHWIETTPAPQPKNAELVNAYDALLKRAEDCRKARGMLPNVLLVDFYRSGDLMGVVRTLNGLAAPADSARPAAAR